MAYCQSLFGSRYMMHEDGETVKLFMSRVTEDQLNEAWMVFITDLKNVLPHEMAQNDHQKAQDEIATQPPKFTK